MFCRLVDKLILGHLKTEEKWGSEFILEKGLTPPPLPQAAEGRA